ncbi:MAG: ferrochelatase [Pirellulaceae bacterium]|nr:ferrochelatase [Pirellulaceae bacterium]
MQKYDSLLFVSFGGPEGPDDVMPFLENVLRGKNVPRERLLEVSEHYHHFGGVSPINEQNRRLIEALRVELGSHDLNLPIYWGNRNWDPLLPETVAQMKADGCRRGLMFMTSAFSCYSGCRQYRENVYAACAATDSDSLHFDKIRVFYNHPGFVEPFSEKVDSALCQFPDRAEVRILFTAHSIPLGMANGSRYQEQLREACRLVALQIGHDNWELVFQSRSGSPHHPWLEPDICDRLKELDQKESLGGVVIAPIGFISDHMEVLFDLDTEAKELCEKLNLPMIRVETVGTHPRFVAMIRELIEERLDDDPVRLALGEMGPSHDVCPENCCPSGRPDSAGKRPETNVSRNATGSSLDDRTKE